MKKALLPFLLFFITGYVHATTYYWVGGTAATLGAVGTLSTTLGGTGNTSAMPFTTNPSADIIIFDGSDISSTAGVQTGTITVTVPSGATTYYGQIILQNGATVGTTSGGTRTLNINGLGSGDDFVVNSGCSFSTSGSTTTIAILTGATGSVSGSVTMGAGSSAHLLTVVDAGALVFNNGAVCSSNPGSNAIPFGTGTDGAIVFASGSRMVNVKCGDPFGGTGHSIVVFQTGSTYEIQTGTAASVVLDGRVFSNLILNSSSNLAPAAGANGFTCDNFSINSTKSLTVAETGSSHIRGNISIVTGGSLILSPASASTIVLDGSAAQTITNAGTLTIGANQTFNVTNAIGVSLGSNVATSGTLSVASSGLFNASTFTLSGTGTFTLNSGGTLKIGSPAGITASGASGNIQTTTRNYTAGNNGNFQYIGTSAQVTGTGLPSTIANLTTNNALGVTLTNAVSIGTGGTLSVPSGAFDLNGNTVTLLSTSASNTATVGVVGGSIAYTGGGQFTIQQYLTAQRAYRLLGHPFNGSIAISSLQSYVDITGSGSGLTAGNASAFNYLTGVWSAYTANTQTWDKNQALFLFVRGTPGQGIGVTDGSYGPNAPTISLTGQVNTGNLNYTVNAAGSFSNGAALGWNAIGNPYPAPIDVNSIGGITSPGGSGASIYVWSATMGSTGAGVASGGYDFRTLGSPIVIPEYGAFFIKNTSGIDQPISFSESNKSTGTPLGLFGANTTTTQSFLLTIADATTYWDKLKISFDDKSSIASTDKTDLEKFSNINLDFYSLASDNNRLAINSRPVLQSVADIIPLGLKTNQQRTFTVQAGEVNLATGSNLYLHDKYTNSWMKIANGMSYTFSVTADAASQGNNRFEVAMKATVPGQPVIVVAPPTALTVEAGPSPMKSVLTIHYASPEAMQTNIRITDMSGKTVSSINAGKVQNGVQQVATDVWNSGVYVVQVSNGKEVVTKKVVKE